MVQVKDKVGSRQNGSMKAVSGSGIASMSDASILFQPRMLEPSKPRPSLKMSSVSSRIGQLKCCQVPKVSTNLMSIILAPLFLAKSITLLGVLIYVVCLVSFFSARGTVPTVPAVRGHGGTARAKFLRKLLQASFRMVALFAMLGEVQAGGFDFRRWPQ